MVDTFSSSKCLKEDNYADVVCLSTERMLSDIGKFLSVVIRCLIVLFMSVTVRSNGSLWQFPAENLLTMHPATIAVSLYSVLRNDGETITVSPLGK